MVYAHCRSPPVNGNEQEQPYNVNEVPVPCGGFKTEMFLWAEMTFFRTEVTCEQEQRTHQNVETVEARGHEEC